MYIIQFLTAPSQQACRSNIAISKGQRLTTRSFLNNGLAAITEQGAKDAQKSSLRRQYSDTTENALFKQIIAAESLRRVTEEAEDAKEIFEKPVVVLFEKLSQLFESCNSEDKDNNHCADTVLIIYRHAIKTGTRSTQRIYCHRYCYIANTWRNYSKLAENGNSKSVPSNNDGILEVEVPHFGLEPAVYHKCIKLLYTGFYLFVKDNSLPHQPRLEDKDGFKIRTERRSLVKKCTLITSLRIRLVSNDRMKR